MYGESRIPSGSSRAPPRSSVIGVGLFTVFVSWMAIAGTGPQKSVELAQSADTSSEIFFGPVPLRTASGPSRCSTSCW